MIYFLIIACFDLMRMPKTTHHLSFQLAIYLIFFGFMIVSTDVTVLPNYLRSK